ncbi:hypothetical protein ACSSWA_02285, partial [Melioribacter sp. Ez-97]|uniref:hypothetical protein n=1 Tax=Melioribacter sp. Ez-97 TaxID=3423434 RepID=UPI003EDB07AB
MKISLKMQFFIAAIIIGILILFIFLNVNSFTKEINILVQQNDINSIKTAIQDYSLRLNLFFIATAFAAFCLALFFIFTILSKVSRLKLQLHKLA